MNVRILALLVLAAQFLGCSFFGSRTQTLTVQSTPPGAEVVIGGSVVGRTPLQYEARRGGSLLVEVRKPGYQTQFRTTSRHMSTLGIVDTIGGAVFLLPFFGLLSDAAWQHDPAVFGFVLEPEPR